MINNFLEKIRKTTQVRVANIATMPNLLPNKLEFCDIFLNQTKPVIIAEIKFASPSYGIIHQSTLSHVEIAKQYLANGASALSILSEPDYFKGNIDYIRDVRQAFPGVNILCKDFILSKSQIEQALHYGANSILLIVAFFSAANLKELYDYSLSLNLTPLIEVHDLAELEIALKLDPKLIGVNNRNLKTLEINLDTARNLIKYIPKNIYKISESGIENKAQIAEIYQLGFNGFLIGSNLMRSQNPGSALAQMLL